jgi:hypothetical protein
MGGISGQAGAGTFGGAMFVAGLLMVALRRRATALRVAELEARGG